MKPALFLDRDGVINVNHGYVHTPETFDFIDGIFELCRFANEHGYLVVVVTNQAGIGRGYYSEQAFLSLTDWMQAQFTAHGAHISKVYFCPDHPEHGIGVYKRESPMRKPGPGMLLAAAREFDIDLAASVLVGDHQTDLQAGRAAGVRHNLLFDPRQTSIGEPGTVSALHQVKGWLDGTRG